MVRKMTPAIMPFSTDTVMTAMMVMSGNPTVTMSFLANLLAAMMVIHNITVHLDYVFCKRIWRIRCLHLFHMK